MVNIPNLIPFAEEGQKLAKKLGIDLYNKIFNFFINLFFYISIIYEKLPVMGMKAESAKYTAKTDDFVNFIWDSQISIFTGSLKKRMENMLNILNDLLASELVYEFIYLQLTLILVGNFVNFTSLVYIDKSTIVETLEEQSSFLKIISKTVEKINDNDLLLYAKICIGGYFEFFDKNKAKEIYEGGLKLSEATDQRLYIRKFEYLIKDLGSTPQKITPNDMRNFPISEVMQSIKDFYFRDIDAIPDTRIKEAMKIALRDIDPTEFLKHCEYLAIDYMQSPLGKVVGLYSLGVKTLMCLKKEKRIESANLELIFNHFKNEICKECEFKSPRADNWKATFGNLDEMRLNIYEIISRERRDE